MYYRGLDLSVMAAEVNTTGSTFSAKEPRVLFRPPGVVPVAIAGISNDGERFAALPPPKGPQLQQITVFDREGKVVNKVGKPGIFGAPAFSPDRTRLAVLAASLETGANNIWIYDIATGQGRPLTNDPEAKGAALWSPDGRHIYWVSVRGSYSGIYRRASDGTGSEELVFRYTPGAGLSLTDISPEEKFLVADSGGVVLAIPLTGTDPLARKAIEYSRSEFSEFVGRLSPNGRFLAFRSDENDPDKLEIYVRPFDASTFQAGKEKWQLSKDGAAAMLHWRNDGKEFFYRAFVAPGSNDLGVMAVDVTTTPTFQAGTPKLLFKIPGPLNGNLQNISPDGQRFVFAINVPAQ
jgi:Tol biopolymer transport system component